MNNHRVETEIRPPVAQGPDIPQRAALFLAGRWPLVVLLLLAALPYIGVLGNDFAYIFDDKALILDNPYMHNFQHLGDVLTSPLWSKLGPEHSAPYYRPIATVGFMLCYQVFGPSSFGFHLVSLLLNAAVVGVLFLLADHLLGNRVAAFAAAGLFALHPVHVEAVAWIAAVTDLEVTLFYLLTFWCFLRIADGAGGQRHWAQALMTVSFALAIFSKEQALTLPLLAMIYEHFYRSDRRDTKLAQKLLRYGPLWLVCLGYFLLRAHVLGAFAHTTGMHLLSTREVLLSAFALVGQYIAILFLPVHLSAFHAFHPSASVFDAHVLRGAMALSLFAGIFGILWKRARQASFGILWLFLTLFPVLNARWMSFYVLGERYLYLPSVGFCFVAGWACAVLWQVGSSRRDVWRRTTIVAACIVATLCALRISTRVLDWRDDITLFTQASVAAPGDFRFHDGLGLAYWIRGDSNKAELEWQETLRLEPNNSRTIDMLGALYAQKKRYDLAIPLLERSLSLNPKNGDAHLNLGAAYAEMGKLDRAAEELRVAVLLSPLNFNAHNLLGKLYFDSQRLGEAEQQFLQSLQCEPNLAAYDHLGYIYVQWGDQDRAEKAFKAALAMKSTDSHAHYNLGLIYAATGRNGQALEELQAARAADPNNPEILSALEKVRR